MSAWTLKQAPSTKVRCEASAGARACSEPTAFAPSAVLIGGDRRSAPFNGTMATLEGQLVCPTPSRAPLLSERDATHAQPDAARLFTAVGPRNYDSEDALRRPGVSCKSVIACGSVVYRCNVLHTQSKIYTLVCLLFYCPRTPTAPYNGNPQISQSCPP